MFFSTIENANLFLLILWSDLMKNTVFVLFQTVNPLNQRKGNQNHHIQLAKIHQNVKIVILKLFYIVRWFRAFKSSDLETLITRGCFVGCILTKNHV